jgi:putative nucleotidyltransferase with HDIG domain
MIRKISIDDLEVGMYVEKVDRPWLEIPFFKKSIQSTRQIDKLREYSVNVLYIDTDKGGGSVQQESGEETSSGEGPQAAVGSEAPLAPSCQHHASPSIFDPEEIQLCRVLQQNAVQCVKEFYASVESGDAPDLKAAEAVVDELINNVTRHPGVMMTLSKLKAYDEYTFTHSVNVSLLAITLGKTLHYNRSDLKTLGLGALFHDIGKTRVSKKILNNPGGLTEDEMNLMYKHPVHSVEILKHVPGMTIDIIRVALEHHERISGTGYPRGLKGSNISEFGMISTIADVYDAMTSDRVYRKKLTSHAALSKIYATAKGNYNTAFVERFITRVGIYPIGTTLILTSGEVGVVSRIHTEKLLCPEVFVLFDKTGKEITPPEKVDLLHDRKKRRVQAVSRPEKFGISVERLLGLAEVV